MYLKENARQKNLNFMKSMKFLCKIKEKISHDKKNLK